MEQKKSRKIGAISLPCAKFSHLCAKFSPTLLIFFCHFYSLFPIFTLNVYKCELRVFLYFSFESFIEAQTLVKRGTIFDAIFQKEN